MSNQGDAALHTPDSVRVSAQELIQEVMTNGPKASYGKHSLAGSRFANADINSKLTSPTICCMLT